MSITGYDNNYVLRETDGASVVGNSNSSKRLLTKWYLEDNPSIFCGSSKWLSYVGSSTNGNLCLRAGNCEVNTYTDVNVRFDAYSASPSAPTETNVTAFGVYSNTSTGTYDMMTDNNGPVMYFSSGNYETTVWGCVFRFSPHLVFPYFNDANNTSNEVVSSPSYYWANSTRYLRNNGYLGYGGTFSAWSSENQILGTHSTWNCIYFPFCFTVTPTSTGVTKSGNNCTINLLDAIINLNITLSPGEGDFRSNTDGNFIYRFGPYYYDQGATSEDWYLHNSSLMEPHTGVSYSNLANYFENGNSGAFIMFYNSISSSTWQGMLMACGVTNSNATAPFYSCRSAIYIGGVWIKRTEPNWNKHHGHKTIYLSGGYNGDPCYYSDLQLYNSSDSKFYSNGSTLED